MTLAEYLAWIVKMDPRNYVGEQTEHSNEFLRATHEAERFEPTRLGWVGPIRSDKQAQKERDAWRECGWTRLCLSQVLTCVRP